MTFHHNPQRVSKQSAVPPPVSVLMISSTVLLKNLVDCEALARYSRIIDGIQNHIKQAH
jgi:hypothetical protein